MKTDLADDKHEILRKEYEIGYLKAAAGSYQTEKTELELKILDLETQKSDWQTKKVKYDDEIFKISKEKDDLTISLKNSERLLREVTIDRDFLKSSLGFELKSAQNELKDIKKERDLLYSFLKSTADSTIAFSKLLSQISKGVMSKYFI